MGTKDFVILALWGIAALVLFLVGINILGEQEDKYNLIALSWAAVVVGFILDRFWKTA